MVGNGLATVGHLIAFEGESTWDQALTTAYGSFATVWEKSADMIKNNPVLMIFLAGGLLVLGFRVFRRARRAVR